MDDSPAEVARLVLEVVPPVMRAIRSEMRRHRTASLSVPQFRTLAFVRRHPAASLSAAAEHLGLTLPSMSKLVDGLVTQQLLSRTMSSRDRRKIMLELTPRGRSVLRIARRGAQAGLAAQAGALAQVERAQVITALTALRRIFETTEEASAEAAWRS